MFDQDYYKYIFKVCVFAMEKVGIKTLARNFMDGIFDEEEYKRELRVLGITFITKDIKLREKGIRTSFWIFSSSRRFESLFPYYISGANGILLMYDITNGESFQRLSEWCHMMENYREEANIPILLIGNKLDLADYREISVEQVQELKEEYDIPLSMEISTETGEKIEEMFKVIAEMMMENLEGSE